MIVITITTTILEATPSPTSPANQQAGYVHRLHAGVVISSVDSFWAPKLGASEASFEAFGGLLGASWGLLGGLLGVFWGVLGGSEAHFGAYTLKRGPSNANPENLKNDDHLNENA